MNQSTQTMVVEAIDAIAPLNLRQAIRRILKHVWIDDPYAQPDGVEPEHLGHAYYLVAQWLYQLEEATALKDESNGQTSAMKTLILLQNVNVTAGAADELAWEDIMLALQRHSAGDWGDVCEEDRQENDRALQNGARILSSFCTPAGVKFWIITDAGHETTTVLLPSEY